MNKIIMVVVVAFVIIGGGILVLSGSDNNDASLDTNSRDSSSQAEKNQQPSDQQQVEDDTTTEEEQETNDFGSVQTVIYDENGFSPEMLTSKAGEKMIIENKSSSTIQVQSNPHPSHGGNNELNVGAIAAGEGKSVTLNTKGTFGFHDHLNPDNTANVVVQ